MRHLLLLALIIALIGSCEPAEEVITLNPPEIVKPVWMDTLALNCQIDTVSSLDSLWQLWKQHEPKHYQYHVINACFCEAGNFNFVIEVFDSKLDTAYPIDYNEGQFGEIPYEQIRRSAERLLIDSLFNLQRKFDSYEPDLTLKTFHDEFQFPCSFYYDFNFGLVDEEFGMEIIFFAVAE